MAFHNALIYTVGVAGVGGGVCVAGSICDRPSLWFCLSGVAGVEGGAYADGSTYDRPLLSRLSVCLVFAETTKENFFFCTFKW